MSDRGFVDVDRGRLSYARDGHGPAVVLIAGGMLDLRMWEPQVRAFSQRYSFLRFDLRGYGHSSEPPSERYRHCDDVKSVLDSMGIDQAYIGGSSLGGTAAIDFALVNPERVAGLILAPALPVQGWQWVEGFPVKPALRLARSEGVEAAKVAFLDLPLFQSAMQIPPVAAELREMVADYSGWHLANVDAASFAAPDAVDRLSEITSPALVIVGGRDVLDSRLTADKLANDLVAAQLCVIDHVGHIPSMEDPEAFNDLVLGFLDKFHYRSF